MLHEKRRSKRLGFLTVLSAFFASVLLAAATAGAAGSYAVNFDRAYGGPTFTVTGTLGPNGANQANWNNTDLGWNVNGGYVHTETRTMTDNTAGNSIGYSLQLDNYSVGDGGPGGSPTDDYGRLYAGAIGGNDTGFWHLKIAANGIPFATYDLYLYMGGNNTPNSVKVGGTTQTQGTFTDDAPFTSAKTKVWYGLDSTGALDIDVGAGRYILNAATTTTTTTTTSTTTTTTAAPPAITGVEGAGDDVVLQWSATNAGSYRVQGTPALVPVAWSNLPGMGPIPGSNGTLSATDTNAGLQKFYRVLWTY
jgi:hypothetical protein